MEEALTDTIFVEDGEMFHKVKEGKKRKCSNWRPTIKALIMESDNIEGFILEHPPKGSDPRNSFKFANKMKSLTLPLIKQSFQSQLTLNQISTHQTIISNLTNAKKLTSIFTKDYHLPTFLLKLLDEYKQSDDQVTVVPLKCFGKQNGKVWVYCNQKNELVCYQETDSCVRIIEFTQLGIIRTGLNPYKRLRLSDNIDDGAEILQRIFSFCEREYLSNFPSTCVTLGAVCLSLHYKSLALHNDGSASTESSIGIPLLIGEPKAGKTSALSLMLSVIGVHDKEHNPTLAGMTKALSNSEVPIYWDDVEDFNVFENVCLMVFNKSARMTARSSDARVIAKTTPIATSNGYFMNNIKGIQRQQKLNRLIGRLNLIPFDPMKKDCSLRSALEFDKELHELLESSNRGFGVMLSMLSDLECISTDPIVDTLNKICEAGHIDDNRELKSYGLLLFATAKLMLKCQYGMEFVFETLQQFMEKVVICKTRLTEKSQKPSTVSTSAEKNLNDEKNLDDVSTPKNLSVSSVLQLSVSQLPKKVERRRSAEL